MVEAIVLGIIQGIAEWLPVSSEGMIVLVKANFFGGGELDEILKMALFLHLGTFLAAVIYFRQDVVKLLKAAIHFPLADIETKRIFSFLVIATIISGIIAFAFLKILEDVEVAGSLTKIINLTIAALLIITGIAQLKAKKDGLRMPIDLKISDGLILGAAQGFAALPGLSRSGLTVSALLLRKFQDTESLRLSFLLSLPIVLAGNIVLNFNKAVFTGESLLSVFFAFIFGYLTIHWMFRLAQKINFGYFVVIFAILLTISVF